MSRSDLGWGGWQISFFRICLISLTLGTSDSLVTFSGTAFLCTSTKERGHVHFFFFIACWALFCFSLKTMNFLSIFQPVIGLPFLWRQEQGVFKVHFNQSNSIFSLFSYTSSCNSHLVWLVFNVGRCMERTARKAFPYDNMLFFNMRQLRWRYSIFP